MCLRERDLVVARIEPHQDVSGIDDLLVFGPHLDHVPGNPSAHGIDVAVDLGVVGGFVRVHVPPQVVTRDAQSHDDHSRDEIARHPGPSARDDRVLLQCRHGYFTSRSGVDDLFGAAQGPRQGHLGHVMGKERRDQRVVGGRDRLLCLHDLDRVGHAGREPVPSLDQRLIREIEIVSRDRHLLGRRTNVEKGGADLVLDLAGRDRRAHPAAVSARTSPG